MLEQKRNEVPWTLQQTFTGILFTLVPWLALAFALSSLGGKTPPTARYTPGLDLTNAVIVFIFSTLIEGAFLIGPFYYANRAVQLAKPRLKHILYVLGFKRFAVREALLWIVALFFAVIVVNVLYQYLITVLHLPLRTNDQLILEQGKRAPITIYATLLVSVLIAPVCEEIFFRSFVFMGLLRGMAVGWAIVFSSLIFAVAHADPGSFVVLLIIGVALAFLRWHTDSIWPGILLHMLNNGIGALFIVLAIQGIVR